MLNPRQHSRFGFSPNGQSKALPGKANPDDDSLDQFGGGFENDGGEFDDDIANDFECPFTEGDLRFLRDFILSSAMYVEELESLVCDSSDDFWEAREHAYRIVTSMLITHFLYEMETPDPEYDFGD